MSDAIEETASPAADGTAVDQAAAEAARAELDARAEKLRASGWAEPAEDRPSWMITKDAATDEQREAYRKQLRRKHLESKARAEAVLARGRGRLIYKTYTPPPEPDIPSESAQMTNQTKTTEKLHPLEVLAEELGIVAARFENEANLKIKVMRGELELSLERRLMEQAKEIAELRGQLSVLLTRAARVEQPDHLIDLNQVRAAVRN